MDATPPQHSADEPDANQISKNGNAHIVTSTLIFREAIRAKEKQRITLRDSEDSLACAHR
jgi:hypothetical protein